MKKIFKGMLLVFALLMVLILVPTANSYGAAKKNKSNVTYKLKKGTLTIKGKGSLKKKFKNKKIKNIIVKKGVTSIPKYAFAECKNLRTIKIASTVKRIGQAAFYNHKMLKSITIPGDFKVSQYKGDDAWSYLGKTKVVNYITDLNYNVIAYIDTNKVKISLKDKKFKSINGIVYTKDGKTLVRVPSLKKEVNIVEGCATFALEAIRYSNEDLDGDNNFICDDVEKITIPSTLKNINKALYVQKDSYSYKNDVTVEGKYSNCCSVIVNNSKNLSSDDLCTLVNNFGGLINEYGDIDGKITEKNGLYIWDDYILMYKGTENTVTIPEGITTIRENAFYKSKMKKVILSSTVEKIRSCAFSQCIKLKNITIGPNVKVIESDAFKGCRNIKLTYNTPINTWQTTVFVNKKISKKKSGKIIFKWAKISNVTGYQVQKCKDNTFKKRSNTYDKLIKKNSLICNIKRKKANYGTKTCVNIRVRPYKKVNGKNIYGKWNYCFEET